MSSNSFWSEPAWVSKEMIQELFNQCQYYELVTRGEIRQRVFRYDNHLKRKQRQKIMEPLCTRSQIVLYSTLQGQPLAIVHQYKRRDGSLGGCGIPDPKRLFISGKIFAIKQSL